MTQYFTSTIDLYAKAIFDYALVSGELKAISAQAAKIQALISQDADLINIISAPIYSEKEQEALLKKIVDQLGLSAQMNNLLNVIARNGKLDSLKSILDDFNIILNEHNGYKFVEVIVAQELLATEQEEIKKQLEKILASKIQASFSLDPGILGGIVIKVDNKMLDASLANRFACLQDAIISKMS